MPLDVSLSGAPQAKPLSPSDDDFCIRRVADEAESHVRPHDPLPLAKRVDDGLPEAQLIPGHEGAFRDASGKIELPPNRTDTLIRGISQIFCREPIFGYRMETYALKGIAFGPANGVAGGHYNTRNPACYLYPEENRCEPGDRFREDQGEAVGAFLTYRPFPFAQPWRQTAANRINLAALVAVAAFLLASAARWLWRRRRDQSATT